MPMSRSEVIQIDATVIVGLLVLMAFQTAVPPTYSQQYNEVLTQLRETSIEQGRLVDLLDRHCDLFKEYDGLSEDTKNYEQYPYPENFLSIQPFSFSDKYFNNNNQDDVKNSSCEQWKLEFHQVLLKRDGIRNWVDALGLTEEIEYEKGFTQMTYYAVGGGLMINTINLLLIFPFAASAVIAAVQSSSKKVGKDNVSQSDNSSRLAKKLMTIGFGSLIIGFIIILVILACGIFPNEHCVNIIEPIMPIKVAFT